MEEHLAPTSKETNIINSNKNPDPKRQKTIDVYSNFFLHLYDYFVLSFCCPLIWRCSKTEILDLYNQYVSNNHLDIGVGTGYFLKYCQFPSQQPKITLLDLSENCLQRTAKRIEHYHPESYQADIFEPLPLVGKKFDSVGMNYLLHCLPGTIQDKASVFENITNHLNPGAVIFGATVLGQNSEMNFLAKKLMRFYNYKGIFSNTNDSFEGLKKILTYYYDDVTISLAGCVALFSAKAQN